MRLQECLRTSGTMQCLSAANLLEAIHEGRARLHADQTE